MHASSPLQVDVRALLEWLMTIPGVILLCRLMKDVIIGPRNSNQNHDYYRNEGIYRRHMNQRTQRNRGKRQGSM